MRGRAGCPAGQAQAMCGSGAFPLSSVENIISLNIGKCMANDFTCRLAVLLLQTYHRAVLSCPVVVERARFKGSLTCILFIEVWPLSDDLKRGA